MDVRKHVKTPMLMNKLKAATGRINITPPMGTPMGGNVRIDNKSRGVHDDLYCNILIIKDGEKKICLLGFDILLLKYETCNNIKSRIEEVTGIPSLNIVIWATHTHSGPDTGLGFTEGIEGFIKQYLENMIEKVVTGVEKTDKKYKEVTLKVSKTCVPDLSFNRRLVKKDGSVVMVFEEFETEDITGATGLTDDELITLSVWDENNKLFAVLVNFALHPAILVGYKWLISRDFIHYLDEYLSDKFGKQSVILYANGAEGDIGSLDYRSTDRLRNFDEAKRIGNKLGFYAGESIENSSVLNGNIQFIAEKVTLPLRKITEQEKQWAEMVLERDNHLIEEMFDGIPDKTYAKMIKSMIVRPDKEFETILQGFASDNFAFITFPGEVFVEYGLQVKKLSPFSNTMIIGLANSFSGYIPEKKSFSQGGYEVRTAWSSQLVYDAGEILVNLIREKILAPMKDI